MTIQAGWAWATFWVRALDDTISDGTQVVILTATSGQVSRSTTVSVTDNEPRVFTSNKFDFGTANSPVATGFTRVTSTTQFSQSQGFGWSAGTIGETDRGGSASDVNRDFNSTADGTFSVNVQNGTYQVTLTIGDAAATRDKMQVYLEGDRVENNLTTQAGTFLRRTYSVRVTDGQLTLRLKDLGGQSPTAVINALEFNRAGN